MNGILALPTSCVVEGLETSSCSPQSYVKDRAGTPARPLPASFADLIDPLLRMKLELAGYTLADAETLQLATSERTERTSTLRRGDAVTSRTETQRSAVPTVAALPRLDQHAVARSLGLQGVVSSTLQVRTVSGRITFGLTLELHTLPSSALALRVRCEELYEFPEETASILANCVGNGVLAWRAPEAVWSLPP